MYIGVDLGTSGIKVVLTDEHGALVDSQTASLPISRPKPLWSEQDPTDWWQAFCACMDALHSNNDLHSVKAMGLSGQMHGATFINGKGDVLRPAILWNDGRCHQECAAIEASVETSRRITGNAIMPGFTAPKALWVKNNEPEIFEQTAKILLPKDYLRFLLTGDFASDMSDAAGTMWLDVKNRCWNQELLEACGLSESHMPTLYEGSQITGELKNDIAQRWGLTQIPVVAGGGDNAAGAIGVGIVEPGQAMLSLGTSGVYFVVSDGFHSNPDSYVHSFCHALPNTWHLMSVHLSAASCLQWYASSIANTSVPSLLEELHCLPKEPFDSPLFLPYLSGERTPHNDPYAQGVLFGLNHSHAQPMITHSIMEGVALAFADGVDAVHQTGVQATETSLIGGGARSEYWRQMLADVLNRPVCYREGGDVGPALGAARLAQLAISPGANIKDVCPVPPLVQVYEPRASFYDHYQARRLKFKQLYQSVKSLF